MADTTTAKPEAKPAKTETASTGSKPEAKTETKDTTATDAGSTTETDSSTSDAPAGYTRGENQKPVTNAYRSNWDKIFGKKSDE